jgi:hypothetical protein
MPVSRTNQILILHYRVICACDTESYINLKVYKNNVVTGWEGRLQYSHPSLVRGLKLGKKVKWKRAEGVEGPSPPGPFGAANRRTLIGPKGPYLLSGGKLIPGFNRPVQSQAVNWATAGLLAFLGGKSSFNDGTSQTVLDPLGRGPVRTH